MKKLMTLTFALMLSVSMAFAQNNTATTDQTGTGHDATISQTGNNNMANTGQEGNGNDASTGQSGDNNFAKVEQSGSNSGENALGFTAGAYIEQSGVGNNEAFITQTGGANYGRIVQDGDLNQARNITPNSPKPGINSIGNDNAIDIVQQGFMNTSITVTVGDRNRIDVFQNGTRNGTGIKVSGNDGTADIDQNGTRNSIRIEGAVSGGNPTTNDPSSNDYIVDQDGTQNRIDAAIGGTDNLLNVTQNGFKNFAFGHAQDGGFFTIDGDINDVTVSQMGDENRAGVTVIGDDNTVSLSQTGMNHAGTATINGSGNSSTITQNN